MNSRRLHKGDTDMPENHTPKPNFPTSYTSILERILDIAPERYAKSRNFINGAVTYLSPYIARGVISLTQVKESVLSRVKYYQAEKLIQELAWREYFQRVWQHHGEGIFQDLKQAQSKVLHTQIPTAIVKANTSIIAIDKSIDTLYETGYMHNHARMYIAMLACNVGQSHWSTPAAWLYYHLLDGDLASNSLSWQWVAGSFSSKKYFANQENINKYLVTNQKNSFLNVEYEVFDQLNVPEILATTEAFGLKTQLPDTTSIKVLPNQNICIYNSYNLDPLWHNSEDCARILLLEPDHFNRFPISDFVLQFIIQLAKDNIPSIQIFTGNFAALKKILTDNLAGQVFYKEHPTTMHYTGNCENRSWLFPEVNNYYPSFFGYWKKCERYAHKW